MPKFSFFAKVYCQKGACHEKFGNPSTKVTQDEQNKYFVFEENSLKSKWLW